MRRRRGGLENNLLMGINSFIPVSYLALLPFIPMFLCT